MCCRKALLKALELGLDLQVLNLAANALIPQSLLLVKKGLRKVELCFDLGQTRLDYAVVELY